MQVQTFTYGSRSHVHVLRFSASALPLLMYSPRVVWGLVALRLITVARDVPRLAAHVARLGAVGAVARDVAGLVAVVARLVGRVPPALGAVTRDVPRLVARVARRLVRALRALTRYVPRAVTPVATVGFLLAVPRKVAGAVAFEALLALPVKPGVAGTDAALRALAGKVPRPVALVARAGTHCNLL